jgi:hypothetical protein
MAQAQANDMTKKEANRLFLSWQTWENLRMMCAGWAAATRAFITWYPGYFAIPKRRLVAKQQK